MTSGDALILLLIVLPVTMFVVIGIWKATAPQKETGCPCCDKHLKGENTHNHEHQEGSSSCPLPAKTNSPSQAE